MLNFRTIFLFLHIIAAGIWIAQIVVALVFNRLIRANADKPAGVTLMMAEVRLLGVLGSVGGPGILLTGLGLLATDRLGFLGIGGITPPWLMIKQIVYIILLVIVFAVIMPTARRLHTQFEATLGSSALITLEMSALHRRLVMISYLHDALVIFNIFMAVAKFG